MKKFGAFVGKFLPPHIGHISVIEKMMSECDEGVVILSDNPVKSKELCRKVNFPYFNSEERLNWIKQHFKGVPNLHFAIIDETVLSEEKNYMEEYAKLFHKEIPYKVNVKYADESYRELNERYFTECEFVLVDRDNIDIHGTDIRNNFTLYKNFAIKESIQDIERRI